MTTVTPQMEREIENAFLPADTPIPEGLCMVVHDTGLRCLGKGRYVFDVMCNAPACGKQGKFTACAPCSRYVKAGTVAHRGCLTGGFLIAISTKRWRKPG